MGTHGEIHNVQQKYLTKKTPFALLNILRVSAAEMLVDGIAAHAAVDSAVTMAKRKHKTAHLKDLTNAKIPNKSKRKQKSDKNIVSLDI